MKFWAVISVWVCLGVGLASAQGVEIPQLEAGYPRLFDSEAFRSELTETPAGQASVEKAQKKLEAYVNRHVTEPEWIVSRLQMYWDSHATEIYIKGEQLDHVSGRAPVPTVRYTATRGTQSSYGRPKLEDIKPYQDSLGMWMHDKSQPGQPLVWADPRKTGRNVESINNEILKLARDAAFLYWWGGDEKYAQFAADIFDVYMTGLYYRDVPVDLNHGQQQTLVGLTSFEVIHEEACVHVAECYDFLHDWLVAHKGDKIAVYEDVFRKWADVIIAGGVPHNNWNLIQAKFILYLSLVMSDDSAYADGRGRGWFLNELLNNSSIRQWSPGRLIEFGFDAETGLWKESPGYSLMVLGEWSEFVALLDNVLDVDLPGTYPVLRKAMANSPEYIFPNGQICGWGDTHVHPFKPDFLPRMIANARKHGRTEDVELFTSMYKCFAPERAEALGLDASIPAGSVEDYVSSVFWSEGVSWFAARTGMDPDNSLMMSISGSKGNHMHAGGISMELYGKGQIMAPDLGRGSGYNTLDYLEFYSQFPAHNTVCVDGVSAYPVMMSQHGFDLEGCWPSAGSSLDTYNGVMLGDFSFIEPETQSDQRRQVLIINTDPQNGYYIDIFRSSRRDGQDKMHDYFYHNLGQEFELSVQTQPTEELSFAGGYLYAYSYLWNKSAAETSEDVSGVFTMTGRDGSVSGMNMWMKGSDNRKVFKAYSPYNDGLSRTSMPYDIKDSPTLTFVARQYGEAWNRPFVAVYEPYSGAGASSIASVSYPDCGDGVQAVIVEKKDGRQDCVISSVSMLKAEVADMSCEAVVAVMSDDMCFMHKGLSLVAGSVSVKAKTPVTIVLKKKGEQWYYESDGDCTVKIEGKKFRLAASGFRTVN